MIEIVQKNDHVLLRISTSNGSVNSGKEFASEPGIPAWHELIISNEQIQDFLKKENWNTDVDHGELIWESGNFKVFRPLEEFEYGWAYDDRFVIYFNGLKWHMSYSEIDWIETSFKKFVNHQ